MADIALGAPNTVVQALQGQSFGQKLKSSCGGIILGIILFLGAFPLVFWNELRAVRRYDALEEGQRATIPISPLVIDDQNDGKLVHFTATTSGISKDANVSDSFFGVDCAGGVDCIAIQRNSEMFLWKEESSTEVKGDETITTYSYKQQWSSFLIDSNSFYNKSAVYKNPPSFDFPSKDFVANPMMAGAFELPSNIKSWAIVRRDNIDASVNDIPDKTIRSNATATTSATRGNGFFFGSGTDGSPKIGDERVWFTQTPPSNITVVGVQTGSTIEAFRSESGKGGDVLLYERGNLTVTQMFEIAANDNFIVTIILRVVGVAMMAIGLMTILNPFKVLTDPVPILGDIVGCGINFVSITVACVVGSITISIAWLIAHPVFGIILLVSLLAVIGTCAFAYKKFTNRDGKNEEEVDGDDENDVEKNDEEKN